MIKPLIVRTVSREQLGYFRHLGVRRSPVEFEAWNAEWSLNLWQDRRVQPGRFPIRADWGGAQILLRVDESWIAGLVSRQMHCEHATALTDPLRAIVLEAAFADMSGVFEEATRKRFSVLATEGDDIPPEDWTGFGFSLDDGDFVSQGEIWTDSLGLGFLANAMRSAEPEKRPLSAFEDLPVRLSMDVGWTDLTISAFRQLEKRDVVLLDECFISEQHQIFLRVGRRLGLRGDIDHSRIVITGEWEEIMYDDEEDAQNTDEILDGISMRLSFDLGERMLTLGEVRQLATGHVFELGRPIRSAVHIRANGKLIGEGELVDVDGQLGVSILTLSGIAE